MDHQEDSCYYLLRRLQGDDVYEIVYVANLKREIPLTLSSITNRNFISYGLFFVAELMYISYLK